jgi:hypothetical protein
MLGIVLAIQPVLTVYKMKDANLALVYGCYEKEEFQKVTVFGTDKVEFLSTIAGYGFKVDGNSANIEGMDVVQLELTEILCGFKLVYHKDENSYNAAVALLNMELVRTQSLTPEQIEGFRQAGEALTRPAALTQVQNSIYNN